MKTTHVLICEDSLDGILTGVAAAYRSRYGHDHQRLELRGEPETMELFSEYIEIDTDAKEADSVFRAVCDKLGASGIKWIDSAANSVFADRADAIYRFLIRGFANGRRVFDALGDEHVARMYEIDRSYSNEANHWQEFVRFKVKRAEAGSDIFMARGDGDLPALSLTVPSGRKGELLTSVIAPRHRVIPRIMPFFADRFHGEGFIIYDETHDMAGLHPPEGEWVIYRDLKAAHPELYEIFERDDEDESRAQELWRIFFEATDIPERYNLSVQRGHLPIWKRKHMTEF